MTTIVDRAVRVVLTGAHWLLKAGWFVRRPKTFGAHAIALTPQKKVILVKLRYARGWRVPGGGRPQAEEPVDAALRELREEIGLVSHGEARPACEFEEATDFKRDTASLVIVRDVRYRPKRWSWEVEEVGEFHLDSLPPDVAAVTRRWIDGVRQLL